MSALIKAQRKQIEKLEKALKYSQDKNVALNVLRKRVNHLSEGRQSFSGERVNLFRTDRQMLKKRA